MANGYFERGEVHWLKLNDSVGYEEGVGRPGVIVSANKENNTSNVVNVLYLTTSRARKNDPRCVFTSATLPRESWVICNQIYTVDKSRLTGLRGKLTDAEMKAVDDQLEDIFDLGYNDTAALNEKDREIEARDAVIAEKDSEIAGLKAQLEANAKAQQSRDDGYRIEIAMWQRLYEKALNQVVDMKYTNDLFLKNHLGREEAPVVVPKVPVEPVNAADNPPAENTPVEEDRLDINNCTITALKKLGFSLALAKTIVGRRPYKTVADLKSVPGMKSTQYRIMEPKLCCAPMVKKPVVADAGCESEEPPVVAAIPEVVEVPEVVKVPEVAKVNVNTASAGEIHVKTGLGFGACYAITGKRKRDGLFKSLDELVIPGRLTAKQLAKYRDMLTV